MNKYQKLFQELSKEKKNAPSDVNDNILIFDGLNTFIRAFGATPSTNEDGDHIGGMTGFLFSIGKAVRDFKPSRCIIVFDGVGGSRRRKKIDPNYKANRANKTRLRRHDHQRFPTIEEEQEAMRHQFSRLISYLDCLPVTFLSIDGIEADDTITYISEMYKDISKCITIVSTDRDFYQLVDDTVRIWSPIKKRMYTTDTIMEEFNVHPNNYVVYRSFTGDKSDNIEGVSGIGPKTINKLLPELSKADVFTVDDVIEKSKSLITESNKYKKIVSHDETLHKNFKLMDLKQLDISAQHKSNIRNIVQAPIPILDKNEFRRLFMEDKMWSTMKDLPKWMNTTWLPLNAFALETHNMDN